MKRLLGVLIFALTGCSNHDWRTADRSSMGLAPLVQEEPEAIVQLYAARAVSWRGIFAVHSWISVKEKNADHYIVYQVIGWRLYRNQSPVAIERGVPDGRWFGAEPDLLLTLKGERAESAIPKIHQAALDYPYQNDYRAWPGPNSNTFISFIIRRTPELGMELPPTAIGRDWLTSPYIVGLSESRTGAQLSFLGVLGLTAGLNEGLEVNIVGLCFGIDFLRPAIKLPLIGRIGMKDKPL